MLDNNNSNNPSLNLKIDDLINEYKRMDEEIKEIDSLFSNSKKLLEDNSKGSRGNFVFVANQTSNLISIKNHKLNLLKSMSDIKKSIIDLKIKEFNLISKNGTSDDKTNEIVENVFKKLMTINNSELIDSSLKNSNNNNEIENNIDLLLEERLKDEENKEINEEEVTNEEIDYLQEENEYEEKQSKFRIVIEDSDNIPLIIDEDYNIIDDEEEDEDFILLKRYSENIVIVRKEEIDGEIVAFDSEENEYEVVSFE